MGGSAGAAEGGGGGAAEGGRGDADGGDKLRAAAAAAARRLRLRLPVSPPEGEVTWGGEAIEVAATEGAAGVVVVNGGVSIGLGCLDRPRVLVSAGGGGGGGGPCRNDAGCLPQTAMPLLVGPGDPFDDGGD